MIRINEWAIDADSRCYITGKPKQRTNKDGRVEEYLSDTKYYGTLTAALNGIREAERRTLVNAQDISIQEVADQMRELDKRMTELFAKALEGKEDG